MLIFAILFNFFTGSVSYAVNLPEMLPNLFFSFDRPVNFLDETHRMNEIKIQGLHSFSAVSLGDIDMGFPFFNRSSYSEFSNLHPFFASTNEPRIESRDSASNNCANTGSKDSSTCYIEWHDLSFLVLFLVMYLVA